MTLWELGYIINFHADTTQFSEHMRKDVLPMEVLLVLIVRLWSQTCANLLFTGTKLRNQLHIT